MKNLAETHSAFPNIGKNLSQLSRANIARMLGITTALISGSTAVAINSRAPSEILLTPAGGEVLLLAETRMNTRDAAAAKRRSAEQDGREGKLLILEGDNLVREGDSLVREGDSLVREGDSLVREGDSLVREGDSLVREGDSLVREGDSLVREGDSLVREGDSLVREGDSLVREGDSLVREGQEGVLAATEAAAQKIANDVLGILRQKTDWSPEKRAAFVDWRINQWLEDSDIPKGSDRYNRWFNASKDKIEGNY